jgi:hypothetical protein
MSSADGFLPSIENMNLSKIKSKTFAVAISTGERDRVSYLPSTMRGPFDYQEMVEYVADLWRARMDVAKVIILSKSIKDKIEWLDAKTVDYIIEKSGDILMDEIFFSEDTAAYTCEAGIVVESEEDKS